MYILVRYDNGAVSYAPLYVHSFRLAAPRKLLEAQQFIRQFHSTKNLDTMSERLRWHRHRLGLMQSEVAEQAGISSAVYADLETGACQTCPAGLADALAELFHVSPEELLDDYNLFLYRGQARQLWDYRERRGLSRKAFSRETGISESSVTAWEKGNKQISRKAWEKYFKGKL